MKKSPSSKVKHYIVLNPEKGTAILIEELGILCNSMLSFKAYTDRDLEKMPEEELRNYEAIIIVDPDSINTNQKGFDFFRPKSLPIKTLPEIAEKHMKRIPKKIMIVYYDYYNDYFNIPKRSNVYRVMDLIIAFILLILALPLLLISMFYIYIKDGRPLLYRQKRRGMYGEHFTLHKLRAYDDITDESGNLQTISTKSGYLIRKYRLNELPQLFNVIVGNMSLVGPRPDDEKDFQQNIGPIVNYIKRYNILPGITGHAQVYFQYCDTVSDFEQRLEYDLYYLKNQSIKLYILTLLRTVKTIFLGKGK